jgi:hypothetical protein
VVDSTTGILISVFCTDTVKATMVGPGGKVVPLDSYQSKVRRSFVLFRCQRPLSTQLAWRRFSATSLFTPSKPCAQTCSLSHLDSSAHQSCSAPAAPLAGIGSSRRRP